MSEVRAGARGPEPREHVPSATVRRMLRRPAGLTTPVFAFLALLAIAAVWGSSYPFTKIIFRQLDAWQFLALRFTLAAIVLAAVFWRQMRALARRDVVRGVALGCLFGSGQILQTVGLAHTAATISGFITGLYVVLTPLCGWLLLRHRIAPRVWLGASMAIIGLAILALQGVSLGLGEWLTLAGALTYALHILGLSVWSTPRNALGLTVVQMVTIAALCDIASAPHGYAVPQSFGMWAVFLYLALVSGALAMFVQTWAQSQMSSSRAAVIMATEPVWAAMLAILIIGEPLTWRLAAGGAMMLAAMFVVESKPQTGNDPPGASDLPKLGG